MDIVNFREKLQKVDPQLDARGYLEQISQQVSFNDSNVNIFSKKDTYHNPNQSTLFEYTNSFPVKNQIKNDEPPSIRTDHLA